MSARTERDTLEARRKLLRVLTPPRTATRERRTSRDEGRSTVRGLVGSGDRIGLFMLPFLAIGLILNIAFPSWFGVGGPSNALRAISIAVLIPGVLIWAWSVVLIVRKVPRGELITSGPYAWVKHPLYTDVALLVLPWLGFLLDTWLGVVLGAVLYVGSRRFARAEEAELAETFGPAWDAYCKRVKMSWL